jgi:hypothetical protein
MGQFIMQPQFRNPWVQNLPNMLQNMALQGIAQKFAAGEGKKRRDFAAEQNTLDFDFRAEQGELNREVPNYGSFAGPEFQYLFDRKTGKVLKTAAPSNNERYGPPYEISVGTGKEKRIYRVEDSLRTGQTRVIGSDKSGPLVDLGSLKGGATDTAPVNDPITGMSAEDAAKIGTGPWANLGAAFDAVAGGLGIDKLFGQEGFFQTKQQARQQLRLIKQLGKSALMNSSRGAIWEQQKIDQLFPNPSTIFTNPVTEAKKFKAVRKQLLVAKKYNNQAINMSNDPKEIRQLQDSNNNINRLP